MRFPIAAAAALSIGLSACTSLFFQPNHTRYPYLELERLVVESRVLSASDGASLRAWVFRSGENQMHRNHGVSQPTRGVVLQFHGNAENMTSHYQFLSWLLFEGWDLIAFDYRGYGDSEGSASDLNGVLDDCRTALRFADAHAKALDRPLVIVGQSLGGNLALRAVADTAPSSLSHLVIDSSYFSFRSIAREKLSSVWFLWIFQPLVYVLISDQLSAGPVLSKDDHSAPFKKTPAVFLHSTDDPVVSYRQGLKLFDAYPGPKLQLTTSASGHLNSLRSPGIREQVLRLISSPKDQFPNNP